jgi:hypothetical protein
LHYISLKKNPYHTPRKWMDFLLLHQVAYPTEPARNHQKHPRIFANA